MPQVAELPKEAVEGEAHKEKSLQELTEELRILKVQDKEKSLQELTEELRILKVQDIVTYNKIIGEIARWASGASDEKRMTLYPSKSDGDFQGVLDELGEDMLSGV